MSERAGERAGDPPGDAPGDAPGERPGGDERAGAAAADDLAFVLTGGGARGAYQVGVLRWLARRYPELRVPILTGVSAGAVNVAHLASHHGTFGQAVEELSGLWCRLEMEGVFLLSGPRLAANVARWGAQLVSGGLLPGPQARALLDPAPLRATLADAFAAVDGELTGIDHNLGRGTLRAAAIGTTSYSSGQSVMWVQGRDIRRWERPGRQAVRARLSVDHVMASSAIPFFFPAVRIGNTWHGDGGVRLTAPLSPALQLGARRIIAISTRYDPPGRGARRKTVLGYPPPATVLGTLLNAVFLDLIDQDAHRLLRFNSLLEKLPPEKREGLRIVGLVTLRPSRDLGRLARRHEPRLPRSFRFLTRGLGTRQSASPDLLSMLMFTPEYLTHLVEVGEEDAERNADRLCSLVESAAPSVAEA